MFLIVCSLCVKLYYDYLGAYFDRTILEVSKERKTKEYKEAMKATEEYYSDAKISYKLMIGDLEQRYKNLYDLLKFYKLKRE